MKRLAPLLGWIPLVSLAASSIVFCLHLPELADGEWGRLGASALDQGWPLLVLLVATFGLRGTSLLQITGALLTGFFTAFWFARTGGDLLTEVMGQDSMARITVAVPIVEEIVKLLPIAILWWAWRRRKGSPGAIDISLFGIAAGAGFAFHEDALWGRLSGSGFDGIGFIFPSVHSETGLVAGHLVWTAFVAVALGIGIALARRHRAWRMLPVAALLLAVADHGTWNSPEARDSLGWLSGGGWIPIIGTIAGLAVAVALDVRRVRGATGDERLLRRNVVRFWSAGSGGGRFADMSRLRRWAVGNWLLRLQARLSYGDSDEMAPTPAVIS